MRFLHAAGLKVVAILSLVLGIPIAWIFWGWLATPAPKPPGVVLDEAETQCMVAELAKGDKGEGMIAVMAVVHNRRSEPGADTVCGDYRGYTLMRAPSQGKVDARILHQLGRLIRGKPVQVRTPGFVTNTQGEYGKGGMPERVARARLIVDDYKKRGEAVFDYKANPHFRCVIRYVPSREDYWFDNVAGTDPVAMGRDGLRVVATTPAGTQVLCR